LKIWITGQGSGKANTMPKFETMYDHHTALYERLNTMVPKGSQIDIPLTTIPETFDPSSQETVFDVLGEDKVHMICLRAIKDMLKTKIAAKVNKEKDNSLQLLVAAGILSYDPITGKYSKVE